jgi:glyoxylase-like metal-dependent hydrolase (beta-lactamase superfamily II)
MLVDTGFTRQQAEVLAFLRESRHHLAVVTHHHEDHSGNVASVAAAGLEVFAPKLALEPIAGGFEVQYYRRRVWGLPERLRCRELPVELRAGPLDLKVVAAPGHSEDMTVLHVPQRGWVFAGDLFITRRLQFLRADEDAHALIASLDRVLALDFDTLMCAHRGVLRDGRAQLQAKRDYLAGLRDQVRELAAQGWSPRRITRRVLGSEQAIYYYTRGHFSRINFVRSFLSVSPSIGGAGPPTR